MAMRKTVLEDGEKTGRWRREFGRWLAEHRRRLDLSQTEAGKLAQMSRTQWTRLELGASGTRRENIPKIAEAVNADLVETYKRAGFDPPRELLENAEYENSEFASLFTKHQKLSEEGKKKFREIIEMVKRELEERLNQESKRK